MQLVWVISLRFGAASSPLISGQDGAAFVYLSNENNIILVYKHRRIYLHGRRSWTCQGREWEALDSRRGSVIPIRFSALGIVKAVKGDLTRSMKTIGIENRHTGWGSQFQEKDFGNCW
jgi:hypothetical protein